MFDRTDLTRRVAGALEFASRTVCSLGNSSLDRDDLWALMGEKVAAETAMLLLFVAPLRASSESLRRPFDALARELVPLARSDTVLSAICVDGGRVQEHAVAHTILSRLGYPDGAVDDLIASTRALGHDFGPERQPYQRLQTHWLDRIAGREIGEGGDTGAIAQSMLGRHLDVLSSTRLDMYELTHAVLYASDQGHRHPRLPRPRSEIAADADAALASSLDTDDHDLTAELLLVRPLLGLGWTPVTTFALGLLASAHDELGFLPGLSFDATAYAALSGSERERFAVRHAYHATYVMGFLCAAMLASALVPRCRTSGAAASPGSGRALFDLIGGPSGSRRWEVAFAGSNAEHQDALAALPLGVALRRGTAAGDLGMVRGALELALEHDLADGPAVSQAAAMLTRAARLTPLASARRQSDSSAATGDARPIVA